MKKLKKFLHGFAGVLLGIIILVSSVFAILSFSLDTVTDTKALADELGASNLTDMVCEAVKDELEIKTMLFQLGTDTFYKAVSEEEIKMLTRSFMHNLAEHFIEGKPIELPYFESDALRQQIETDLTAYAEANGLEVEEGSVDDIYTVYCGITSSKVAVIAKSFLDALPTLEKYTPYLNYGPHAALVAAVSAVLLILLNRKKLLSGAYAVLGWVWSGAALVFIPCYAFRLYDLPSRIALARSPLKELVRNAVNAVLDRVVLGSGTVLLIAFAFLTVTIIAMTLRTSKKSARQNEQTGL